MNKIVSYVIVSLLVSSFTLAIYHFSGMGKQESPTLSTAENPKDSFPVLTSNTFARTAYSEGTADNLPNNFTEAAERSAPAVVHIKSYKKTTYRQSRDPFFELFGVRPQNSGQESLSTGSGVIISPDGYIVTNNHVIAEGDRLEVTLYDNRSYMATVIGTDPATDLGLLKVDGESLPYIEFSDSDNARIGQWVLAVGNPFNLSSTVTAGIVSAIGRDLEIIKDRAAIESFIQTDAAVNPGNSGGALVNMRGQLVGINTAIASPTGVYAGYAFAVPANIVRKIVADLKEYGSAQRGFMGIYSVYNLNGNLAKELGVGVTEGVVIKTLASDGSAKDAGIQEGDIIMSADDITIKSDAKLKEVLARKRPGDQVSIDVLRDGKPQSFLVSLTNQEGTSEILGTGRSDLLKQLGADFGELSESDKKDLARYNIPSGAKVSKLYAGKFRQQTEIKVGFVILKVNGDPIKGKDELNNILEKEKGRKIEIEGYYPGYTRLYSYSMEL